MFGAFTRSKLFAVFERTMRKLSKRNDGHLAKVNAGALIEQWLEIIYGDISHQEWEEKVVNAL